MTKWNVSIKITTNNCIELYVIFQVIIDGREDSEIWVNLDQDKRIGWSVQPILWPPTVNLSEPKIDIKLNKCEPVLWQSLPRLATKPPSLPSTNTKILSLSKVNHNVYLIKFTIVDKVYYHVPVGYHLLCTANVKGYYHQFLFARLNETKF